MRARILRLAMLAGAACAAGTPRAALGSDQLLAIAPASRTCAGAPVPAECRTNVQAAPFLAAAMAAYHVDAAAEIAAVLSVVAFETGDFKYNTNVDPGRPGQGTRNMQLASSNLRYAASIPDLAAELRAITTAASTDGLSNDTLNAIRALVLPDEYAWASPRVRAALQAGGQAGFEAYMGCLGVTATPDRLAYWTRATAVF
ncbi:unnamed protein product [Diplocarpon coronariae]